MLLIHLKQLDLPPTSIKLGDGNRREGKVVGQEEQSFAGLGVFESDARSGVSKSWRE